MGRCIICGSSVDGRVCDTHEEDVVFEFRGRRPDQLTTGRFYEGTVDGYADFGVFVDVGDHVTGLLHQSELDQRLETLDWEPGDTVYVKVLRVRDNDDVDLGWSIRQSADDFRGRLVHDPDADGDLLPEEADGSDGTETPGEADGGADRVEDSDSGAVPNGGDDAEVTTTSGDGPAGDDDPVVGDVGRDEPAGAGSDETTPEATTGEVASPDAGSDDIGGPDERPDRVGIATLDERVDERVLVEGEVVGVRQTGGPTIFEVRDETGTVDVAAFVGAGERAYPEIEAEDVVRILGDVELRRDEIQVESEVVERLSGEDAEAVRDRMDAALDDRARPDDADPLADHVAVEAVSEDLVEAATAIRRAVFDSRPVVVRHTATADGYVAGAAIERAVLPLVREEHTRSEAEYHFFDRRPLEGPIYEMDDATADVTSMLEDHQRHDEPLPLVVLVDAGSTIESLDGLELLDVYGVERLVVDADDGDPEVAQEVDELVNPSIAGVEESVTTTALAANLAVHVNGEVRADLQHLPAVSYWGDAPEDYGDLAESAGYDETATRELREALALAAFYQTYEDKRQLVTDLLFGEAPTEGDARGLAAHVSEQFREKVNGAIETARANAEVREAGGLRFTVLDAESFTDQYEFPRTDLLVDVLHRREDREGETQVTLVITADELYLRSDGALDVREVADEVAGAVPDAGVRAVGGRTGRLAFVGGERSPVLQATVQAIADVQ